MPNLIQVSKFSTGHVQIRPQHVGPTAQPTLLWLLTATRWTQPRPINVYVAKHARGTIVFDTGQDIASVNDPEYFPKGIIGWLYSRLAKFQISPSETFEAGLAAAGLEPNAVDFVIISHLHQDHIGGLKSFVGTDTRVIAHKLEVEATQTTSALLDGYMKDHIFFDGLKFEHPQFGDIAELGIPGFNSGWDVFGDGSAIVLEVAGHTAGSIALLLNYGSEAPVLLVGDLTYDTNLLRQGKLPGVGNRAKMKAATAQVLELAAAVPGLVIAAAHDPNVQLPN